MFLKGSISFSSIGDVIIDLIRSCSFALVSSNTSIDVLSSGMYVLFMNRLQLWKLSKILSFLLLKIKNKFSRSVLLKLRSAT